MDSERHVVPKACLNPAPELRNHLLVALVALTRAIARRRKACLALPCILA